ncbi:unnamed protein product [Kuraishia capsulata CBS 1993]|uniref:Nucleoporin n=1 Tax=Kuraishia capsulata CBS 1993 TaxID=1382522 RepID=W6MQ71_9ASCO|nr:uncharacterized protein KUCA_T00003385001 [Kuraishia capsulata CBS 1993]CDK27407.1 unnamed protein product [Kuraishia capsulata CBS 1993]
MSIWSAAPFSRLYQAIQTEEQDVIDQLVHELGKDLGQLVIHPNKASKSRSKLESKQVTFSDGLEYELNEEFVLEAIQLAEDLDLDELAAAETLFYATESEQLGVSTADAARAAFYIRRQYILMIVSYFMNVSQNQDQIDLILGTSNEFALTILNGFKAVERDVDELKNQIERRRLLAGIVDPLFMKTISFKREFLFMEHQVLGEILYGLVCKEKVSKDQFLAFYEYTFQYDPEDLFVISIIPAAFAFCANLAKLSQAEITNLHQKFRKDLENGDSTSSHPVSCTIIMVFLVYYIAWLKKSEPDISDAELDESVIAPMKSTIEYGSMEQFLCLAAETSDISLTLSHKRSPFYDFRALLQQHIPRLIPKRLMDVDEAATKELKRALDHQRLKIGASTLDEKEVDKIFVSGNEISLSANFVALCSKTFSTLITDFIANAAFLLTQLQDSEEDIIVSSESFSLDAISESADLERFYLAAFYVYSDRPQLASQFWDDKSSSSFGFLQWAAQCNSPLISSTFSVLLSALSCSEDNANEVYKFLQTAHSDGAFNGSMGVSGNSSRISWPVILESLAYYNKSLSEVSVEEDPLTGVYPIDLQPLSGVVTPELGDDSVLFIAGYLQLVFQVSIHSTAARNQLFTGDASRLPKLLGEFLKFQTSLVGATLTVLGSLVEDERDNKRFVWNLIEDWIFAPRPDRRPLVNKGSVITKHVYYQCLTNFAEVSGFADLVSCLMSPTRPDPSKPYEPLEYTFDLQIGGDNRKQGVWTYIDFLMTEVFTHSDPDHISETEKISLQIPLLQIMLDSLASFDPDLVFNATACGLPGLDNIVDGKNFVEFMQSSPAGAVLNYLYTPNVQKVLFKIAGLGIDRVFEGPHHSDKIRLVTLAIKLIDEVLRLERFYIDELLPILKQDSVYYIPSDVGTHGLDSFYDALALQLPLVAEICLYVGTTHLDLVLPCISILAKISLSQQFAVPGNSGKYPLINESRLLTMLETVDETLRIRQAFMDQLESPIEDSLSTSVKVELLQFLNNNLSTNGMSVAHFLIGFNTRDGDLGSEDDDGTIKSSRSLLKSLTYVLKSSLSTLKSGSDIIYTPLRISSLILEIILKLLRSPKYGSLVLEVLRDGENLFMEIANLEPKVDLHSYWGNRVFEGVLNEKNSFTAHGESIGALIAFIIQRGLMLQFFGMELHSMSLSGSMLITKEYVDALIDTRQFVAGSAKVLEFLDVLEFTFENQLEKRDDLFAQYDFDYVFAKVKLNPDVSGNDLLYDFETVQNMIRLNAIESRASGVITDADYAESIKFFDHEKASLISFLNNHLCLSNFKRQQLQCLHSWVTLIEVIISDGKLDNITRSNFILEVFQCILPKINDYLELDGNYAEELLSLCVLLLEKYEKDKGTLFTNQQNTNLSLDADRLYPIFKVCINGIFSSQSTPNMRSDMYILINKYLTHVSENKAVTTAILVAIRASDKRLLSTICNDSLMGEGSSRVTALLLLENFVKVSSNLPTSPLVSNFILDTMKRDNYLLLLTQTIRRADSVFKATEGITLDILLYELTIFKTSAYLLLRIAQSNPGASHLMQCGVFNYLRDAEFLKIDPDLGLKLSIGDGSDSEAAFITFSLDPRGTKGSISFYDVLIPVFQLVSAMMISLGPMNKICQTQIKELLQTYSALVVGIFKRDTIATEQQNQDPQLKELTNLFTLLYSCVGPTSQSGNAVASSNIAH